ncbi:CMGC family protein kinase [Histomonas meleagridis]|uniref:CMGC family protein kinase n=1 Tax=Histomonas meleagridis TaxID=135588 RepID=UPI00355A9F6E|nr:CMGC family protein kinase [Histomonas meleagridis]KAH0800758.1 CMGC family protein kinase [Histomonas meleagridis]
MSEEEDFPEFDDKDVNINLELLSNIQYTQPVFREMEDFSISSLIYHGNMSSLFHGKMNGQEAILEVCTRIPFKLVCREISLLNELNNIPNIIKIIGITRNPSMGIITLAYEPFPFLSHIERIPHEKLYNLLISLLFILKKIHKKGICHGWICRSSVMVSPDFSRVVLSSFHSAAKIDSQRPLTPNSICSPEDKCEKDPRKDDIYSAALWFLSFFKDDPKVALKQIDSLPIEQNLIKVIKLMTTSDLEKRITADIAIKYLQKLSLIAK